jgi:hypothetical protein
MHRVLLAAAVLPAASPSGLAGPTTTPAVQSQRNAKKLGRAQSKQKSTKQNCPNVAEFHAPASRGTDSHKTSGGRDNGTWIEPPMPPPLTRLLRRIEESNPNVFVKHPSTCCWNTTSSQ